MPLKQRDLLITLSYLGRKEVYFKVCNIEVDHVAKWLHHYSATAHVTAHVTAHAKAFPDPNPDPDPNFMHSICRTYS